MAGINHQEYRAGELNKNASMQLRCCLNPHANLVHSTSINNPKLPTRVASGFGIPGEPATGVAWVTTDLLLEVAHPAAYAAGSPMILSAHLGNYFTIPCIFIHSAQRAGHVAHGLPSLRRPKPWPPVL